MNINHDEAQVVVAALTQFIDNTPDREDVDEWELRDPHTVKMLADREAAVKLLEKIEAVLIPAMEAGQRIA